MSDDFQTLLTEVGIEFWPIDFVPCPVRENSVFRYQYAMLSPSGEFEWRYRIDSFQLLESERRAADAGTERLADVSLNQMYATNFMSIIFNLSGGMLVEPAVFRPEVTALLFHADWSAQCFVRLADSDFAPNYNSAFCVAIHKDGVADIYVIGVYNDRSGATGRLDKDSLPPDLKKYLAPNLRFI